MIRFNQLLASFGIDPTDVLVLRHRGDVGSGRTPWNLWHEDRVRFEEYQATQRFTTNGLFRRRPVWAGFIGSNAPVRTRFIGLWNARWIETRQPDPAVLCPLSNQPVGQGRAYDFFGLEKRPEMRAYVDYLEVEWPGESYISWFRDARNISLKCNNVCIETDLNEDLVGIDDEGTLRTERLAQALARVGQGPFRDRLFEAFEGRCPVTLVDDPALLRASHIKRWADCDANSPERIDPENGLLLAAHIDALFEAGLIGFQDNGGLLISKALSAENRQRLLPRKTAPIPVSAKRAAYLKIHRDRHGF